MKSEILNTIARTLIPRTVRNSLRSPAKFMEWVWDSTTFTCGEVKSLTVLPEWKMECHPHAYRAFFQAQVDDPIQRAEFVNFISHCSERMHLFDIGAHYGIFSIVAAHFGATVIAVDPSPSAARMINIQSRINQLESSVRVIRNAVSDTCGTMGMLTSGNFSYGYFKVMKNHTIRDQTQVETTTIDQMASLFGRPTHIKVDVEGHELAVIRGGRATLRETSPILFLELHNEMVISNGQDPEEILDELDHSGYLVYDTDGRLLDRRALLGPQISRVVAKAPERQFA